MNPKLCLNPRPFGIHLTILLATLLFGLIGSVFSSPTPANADAGGWPTATPTLTPLPPTATQPAETLAALPTLPQIIFPSTNTPTPSTVGLAEGQSIPQVIRDDEPGTNRNLTALVCWPLGIILAVGAIVGLFLLRNRIISSAP